MIYTIWNLKSIDVHCHPYLKCFGGKTEVVGVQFFVFVDEYKSVIEKYTITCVMKECHKNE